jgi:predicted ATPase
MAQRIVIKNFRQIKDADIEIKNITVLIGENATGKSTVAKLVYFFKCLGNDFKTDILNIEATTAHNSIFKELELLNKFVSMQIENKFIKWFGEIENNTTIKYFYKENDFIEIKGSSVFVSILKTSDFEEIKKYRELIFELSDNLEDFSLQNKNQDAYFEMANQIVCNIFEIKMLNRPGYFLAGRSAYLDNMPIINNMLQEELYKIVSNSLSVNLNESIIQRDYLRISAENAGFFMNAVNLLQHKNTKLSKYVSNSFKLILKANYRNNNGVEQLESNDVQYSLLNSSSGQKESLRILQDINLLCTRNHDFRIYEEPEAHLFPTAQKLLIELMVLMVNYTNSQIIITTHNPYILSVFNNLLFYNYILEKDESATETLTTLFGVHDLNAINNEKININTSQFSAYQLSTISETYCQSIIDIETKMINNNFLDDEIEKQNNDFYALNAIYAKTLRVIEE